MKKALIFLLTLGTLATVFTGCKRGEEDPGLSFASRDARIMGEWLLSNWEETNTYTENGTTVTETRSYNGTTLTYTIAGITVTESFTLSLSIQEGGILSVTRVEDGDTDSDIGSWNWVNSDKKKLSVDLNSISWGGRYHVLRLSGKELILTDNHQEVDINNGDTETSIYSKKLTFAAQ